MERAKRLFVAAAADVDEERDGFTAEARVRLVDRSTEEDEEEEKEEEEEAIGGR